MSLSPPVSKLLRLIAGVLLAQLAVHSPLVAQVPSPSYHTATEPDVPEKAGKVLRALRIESAGPVLDGVLDEPLWATADSAGEMVQLDPDNMQPMSERTVVRVLYDERYLYVGVELLDHDAAAIARGLGRREQAPPSDRVEVGFDTQHDHLTGYVFGVNPSGVQQEHYAYDDTNQDREYNVVWEVQTRVTAAGWTAEFRIPFSQMRFQAPPAGEVVWGFDLRRTIHRHNESGQWVGRPRGVQGQVSRWGHLVFGDGLAAPRRVEALPFLVARGDDPAGAGFDDGYDGGLDLRTGLGRSATLAATFNPDFGQVEADPAVLNLGVFETFFPEKRPFFLEDGSLFVPAFPLMQLFHSRRIGKRPGYLRVQSGDLVLERPDQTTILGAGKVTGKSGGYTYGLLNALTSAEYATVRPGGADAAAASTVDRLIEPLTSYGAARLQRDLGRGSNVGALATAVVRDGAPDAFAGGIDYRVRWNQNRWQWNGHWAGVRSPRAGEIANGFGGVSNIFFNSKRWSWNAHVDAFSRRFQIGDVGFHRTTPNRMNVNSNVGYGNPDPGALWRNWNLNLGAGQAYTTDRLLIERWTNVFGYARFLSYWAVNGSLYYSPTTYDHLDTRGGPPILNPANRSASFGIDSDSRKSWSVGFYGFGGDDESGGWNWSLNPSLELRPSPRAQLSLSGGLSRTFDQAQWITNDDVDGDGTTDHVYGALRSDVLNLTLRGSVAVDRDLTFEGFLQPFVAVGDYHDIKRLAQPRSFDFDPLPASSVENPDFNTKSLRGTFVLRWEYLRGSTVFLVWNVQGSDAARPGVFDAAGDMRDVFGAPLDNRFMIKANYWLAL